MITRDVQNDNARVGIVKMNYYNISNNKNVI